MFAAKNELLTRPSGGYTISRSLRFRSSATAYLNRTPASAGNQKTFTISCWVKKGKLGSTQQIFVAGSSSTNRFEVYVDNGNNVLEIDFNNGAWVIDFISNAVLRDVSAWYHLVVAVDTTQTGTAQVRAYINGSPLTWSTSTSATANTNTSVNTTVQHSIGYNHVTGVSLYDGYLAEYNFLDGYPTVSGTTYNATTWAALNVATLFGAYDTNGVWQPKAYTGTYSGNSFYLPFSATPTSSFAASFNGSSQYLTTATNAGLGLGTSDFTVEYWMNNTAVVNGSSTVTAGPGTGTFDGLFGYTAGTAFVTYLSSNGSAWDIASNRTAIATLTAGRWYHMAYTRSGSTWRVFADGTQVDTFTSSASLYQSANQFAIARVQSTNTFNGLISNVRVIKGTALYTSNFTPSAQPLTAVTNTQLLTLQSSTIVDNSPNNLTITNTGSVTTSAATPWGNFIAGQDSSGAGNNWASANVNVTSSGTTYDSMIDSPTNYADGGNGRGNYCVMNPLQGRFSSGDLLPTYSNGNLQTNNSGTGTANVLGSLGASSGAFYYEVLCNVSSASGNIIVGVQNESITYGTGGGLRNNGTVSGWTVTSGTAPTFTTGDIIGVAFNISASTFQLYKNGTLSCSGTFTYAANTTAWAQINGATDSLIWNFGQRPFTYTPPSGFSALNTQNLPTPTIANGAQNFDATLWTGNTSTSRSFSGWNFAPGFIWVKSRSAVHEHALIDIVRGTGAKVLNSNSTAAEWGAGLNVVSFDANGFSGSTGTVNFTWANNNNDTYVGWGWKAGGTGVSNTSGSITSTVSANTSAGFSVVTWTGTGATGTIGHGLSPATPSMVIAKCRNTAGLDWPVYHSSLTNAATSIYLNLTNAAAVGGGPGIWNSTAPDSTKFNVGTSSYTNGSTQTYVAYCFAPVAGYSSAFSYTGNGSSDGPMVYLGFRPRWILWKRTDAAASWCIHDTSRDISNASTNTLRPNESGADGSVGEIIDILSNGFKVRSADAWQNASGGSYIGYAIAENPFKVSRAR